MHQSQETNYIIIILPIGTKVIFIVVVGVVVVVAVVVVSIVMITIERSDKRGHWLRFKKIKITGVLGLVNP